MIEVQADTTRSSRLVAVPAVAYVAATLIGVVMRFQLVGLPLPGRFDHLLHAHSHTLYFGWGALGVLIAAAGAWAARSRAVTAAAVMLVPLGVGFLLFGYAPFTIAVSTVVMFLWYAIAVGWWRRTSPGGASALLIRGGIGYMVASTVGIWVLAAAQANELGPLVERLGIHAFLSGFGWFFALTVTGVVLRAPEHFGLDLDVDSQRRVMLGWIGAAWLVFPLAVPGGPDVPVLGPVARLAGGALLVVTTAWAITLWRSAVPGPNRAVVRWSAVWLVVGAASVAAVAVGGDGLLMTMGRQGVVIHLHALFVGYVTPLLVLALTRPSPSRLLEIHQWTLAAMVFGLGLAAVGFTAAGMWIAALAGTGLWLAGVAWAWRIAQAPA